MTNSQTHQGRSDAFAPPIANPQPMIAGQDGKPDNAVFSSMWMTGGAWVFTLNEVCCVRAIAQLNNKKFIQNRPIAHVHRSFIAIKNVAYGGLPRTSGD